MENKKCDCKDCQCGGTKQSTTAFDFWTAPDWSIFNTVGWDVTKDVKLPEWLESYTSIKIYDPEKYDLVEKKDYKIKEIKLKLGNLRNSILLSKKDIEKYEELLLKEKQEVEREKEVIIKLEQELQELENKKKE